MKVVLVDVPVLFDRPGLYAQDGHDYPDNALRFATLARAALEYARLEGERYDVIHAHDWQTGLVPVFQKMHAFNGSSCRRRADRLHDPQHCVPGRLWPGTVNQLGLGWEVFNAEALEYWGNVSILKGGVNFSDTSRP